MLCLGYSYKPILSFVSIQFLSSHSKIFFVLNSEHFRIASTDCEYDFY